MKNLILLTIYRVINQPEEWRATAQMLDNTLSSAKNKTIMAGIESLFSGSVISSWTAFETLAADLWVACLNCRPRLGVIALNAEPDANDDEDKAEAKRRIKYDVPVFKLREWNFDL